MAKKILDKEFDLLIMNLDEVVYKGRAVSLTCYNDKGVFDILSYHESFISLIKTSVKYCLSDGICKIFDIDQGILRVKNNTVEIFLGIK